ncbi:GRAS family protein RAD1-like [Rhodamnia argentea]|uniref:GRAS family protein RAD1-like n=1 Tax=Rhodamnia argentea TaxID=178133 RepID=A0A8B8NXA9_9MYRT|nr:GRAS family protein RAD1-like [Rhodamnia argentea]
MEALDGWLHFPMHHDSINHDFALRRFCPARLEQEQGQPGQWEEEDDTLWIQIHPHCSPNRGPDNTPHLASSSEVDEFVDSFINMEDHHIHDNVGEFDGTVISLGKLEEDIGGFSSSMANDARGGDHLPLMINNIEGDEMDIITEESIQNSEIGQGMVNQEASQGVDQGLHLVHSLLACAEAVGCRDMQLADSLLSQIWGSVTPLGDSLQRVAYCFAVGLKSRLSLLHNVNMNGTFSTTTPTNSPNDMSPPPITREEKMEAFQLLHQTTPYVAFGYVAANEAIHQAAQGRDSLHIIDLGLQHTLLQWPSLLRTLASRTEGPPRSLRITGLIGDPDHSPVVESAMTSLAQEAASLGITLQFNIVMDPPTPSLFTREKLGIVEGEALYVNSMMQMHQYVKESRGSLKLSLQAIRKLGPTLLTVIEQDANHNGPFFLGRFLESLHYYSAIFDSLEASLPRSSVQRMKIEGNHYAEEIRNVVACEGSERRERGWVWGSARAEQG